MNLKLTEEEYFEMKKMESHIDDDDKCSGLNLANIKDNAEFVEICQSWRRHGQLEMKEALSHQHSREMEIASYYDY